MASKAKKYRPSLRSHLLIFAFGFTAFLLGCESEEYAYKPSISGYSGEVLVVADANLWERGLRELVFTKFEQPFPMLPQGEPLFTVIFCPEEEFTRIWRAHRNILWVALSDSSSYADTSTVELSRNTWAEGQLLIKVSANSMESLRKEWNEQSNKIIAFINKKERTRLQNKFSKMQSEALKASLKKNNQLSLVLPKDCELVKHTNNFTWIRRERQKLLSGAPHDITQGIFIYSYPYREDSTFTLDFQLQLRDSLLKKYVPGPNPKSYMTTEYLFPPEASAASVHGEYALEVRGLWKLVNGFMGGPFISLSMLDVERQRVITVEGFVFAPKFDKREYLKEVEAMVYSTTLLSN